MWLLPDKPVISQATVHRSTEARYRVRNQRQKISLGKENRIDRDGWKRELEWEDQEGSGIGEGVVGRNMGTDN